MKQDSKSPCSSKAAASRENHAGNWIQSGTVTASIYNPGQKSLGQPEKMTRVR